MRYRFILGCVITATSMLACSEEHSTSGTSVTIAYITTSECNPLYDPCRFGARQAETDLTSASGQPVNVVLMEPQCSDAGVTDLDAVPQQQVALIEEAIDMKVDAILIDVFHPDSATGTINQAVEAGIKVITWSGDAPESNRHTFYGLDNKAAAAFLMDALATINGETGEIVLQSLMDPDGQGGYAIPTAGVYGDRIAGFSEALVKYPNMTRVLDIPCNGTKTDDPFCALQAEQALMAHPEITGFFFARGKLIRELNLEDNAPLLTAKVKGCGSSWTTQLLNRFAWLASWEA